jgi:hypothetical protein
MTEFDYHFISADTHIGTPPQLADELPAEHRARGTHLEERSDGMYLVRPMSGGFTVATSARVRPGASSGGSTLDLC